MGACCPSVPRSAFFLALLLLPPALTACGGPKAVEQKPLTVQTTLVGTAGFAPGVDVISRLESTSNVVLRPEVDGRVVRILARQGQRVKAGQPILVLDNVQESAQLNASQAEAVKDKFNAERYVFLNQQGAVSTKDRDYYVTKAIQSGQMVRANAATLGYKFLLAPIDGIIGNLDRVKIGDFVTKGQAITGIVDNSMLWTLMDVPSIQATEMRLGLPVLLRSQGAQPVQETGRVVYISPYFTVQDDHSSPNTVLVKAVFPNSTGRLKTGEFVRNRIVTSFGAKLALPAQAVLMQAQTPFVYKVVSLRSVLKDLLNSPQTLPAQKERLQKLPGSTPIVMQTQVQLGQIQGSVYPVLGGLSQGDQVVISNTAMLRSGMPVQIASGRPGA